MVEYVIRKGTKVIEKKELSKTFNAKYKTNKAVLDAARLALAEKLHSNGKHRIEVRRKGEKVGEWTCKPAKIKKNAKKSA